MRSNRLSPTYFLELGPHPKVYVASRLRFDPDVAVTPDRRLGQVQREPDNYVHVELIRFLDTQVVVMTAGELALK